MESINGILSTLSNELVAAVEKGGKSVVRIDDGTRLTASGCVWNGEGIIVATSHGVESDEGLAIETGDGKRYEATVVGRDPESDIAVLKVDGAGLTPFEFSTSPNSAGALVLALGRPGQAGLQCTFGIVSSLTHEGNVLHADATLYPGFSGGALVDTQGRLAGLLNVSFGRGRGAALSHAFVSGIVESILKDGVVQRGYLGVGTQPVEFSGQLRQRLPLTQDGGLLVVSIESDSPADLAGLLIGDVIAAIDGREVEDPRELRRTLRRQTSGASIVLKVVRGGELVDVTATLGAREGLSTHERGFGRGNGREEGRGHGHRMHRRRGMR
jgi:S1-C subfamily serine protease